jgi:hypothetical protein
MKVPIPSTNRVKAIASSNERGVISNKAASDFAINSFLVSDYSNSTGRKLRLAENRRRGTG